MSSSRLGVNQLLPPFCLLVALATLIAAFALLAVGSPEASVELHSAVSSGDDQKSEVLKDQLADQQWAHTLLVGCLFAASVASAVAAFCAMRPTQ